MKGFNINCDTQEFCEQIFNKEKTIETRNSPSLHSLINQKVAIIETRKGKQAMIVGYCVIGYPIIYFTKKAFNEDFKLHRIAKNSPYAVFKNDTKIGYPLLEVTRLDKPIICKSKGNVIRNI